MKILFVSNLFPNRLQPVKGIFNAHQVQELSKLCTVTVIAPTSHALPSEHVYGAHVHHPAFFHVPVLSRPWNGWLFARSIEPLLRAESFDIALASFAYPDGYALMKLAKRIGFRFGIDVLGSDVNLLFRNNFRRHQILKALRTADVVFAKSKALVTKLTAYGIHSHLDCNGINRSIFRLMDRTQACQQLGLLPHHRRILYVGNLQTVKGPKILTEAFRKLSDIPDLELLFVGSGPEATKIPANDRVKLLGSQIHDRIPLWMNACDVLCLPSLNEGLPNVLIEALACGLPAVASNVGGVPEVIRDNHNGLLVPPGDPSALAMALRTALVRTWDKNALVNSINQFDWDKNARQLFSILRSVVDSPTFAAQSH